MANFIEIKNARIHNLRGIDIKIPRNKLTVISGVWMIGDESYGYACRGYGGQELNILPKEEIVYVIQATATPRSKSYGDVFGEVFKRI